MKKVKSFECTVFFLTDQVEKGNLSIEYCPTDVMWADFMTKPLQGEKFRKFVKKSWVNPLLNEMSGWKLSICIWKF